MPSGSCSSTPAERGTSWPRSQATRTPAGCRSGFPSLSARGVWFGAWCGDAASRDGPARRGGLLAADPRRPSRTWRSRVSRELAESTAEAKGPRQAGRAPPGAGGALDRAQPARGLTRGDARQAPRLPAGGGRLRRRHHRLQRRGGLCPACCRGYPRWVDASLRALERAAADGDPEGVAAWHRAWAQAGGTFSVSTKAGRIHTWNGRRAAAYEVNVLSGTACGQWVSGAPVPSSSAPTCSRCLVKDDPPILY